MIGARVAELLATEGPGMHQDLMVLPDFNGNRSPLAEPRARGVIHGLALDHSFDSLARLYYATATGIALGTRHIVGCTQTLKRSSVRALAPTGTALFIERTC